MTAERIRYRSGYVYQLAETYRVRTALRGHPAAAPGFIELDPAGWLTIHAGYAWDGPSGPTIDTANFMRGSLVHDALYQLIREGHLPASCRDNADRELRRICLEDGMSSIRAWWVYHAVRLAGGPACKGDGGKTLCAAP